MKTIGQIVAERIKKRRAEMGYKSQQALADAIGTDRSRVGRWETGTIPDPEYRATLLRLLKMTEEELFGIEEAQPTKTASELLKMIEERDTEIAKLKHDNENLQRDLNSTYDHRADEERLLDAYREAPEILQVYAWFFLTGEWGDVVPLEVHRQEKIEAEREQILHLVPAPKSPKE